MKNMFKFSISILLLMPVITGTINAAEEVEIPFHLGKGQLLYEKYCSSYHGQQLTGSDQGPSAPPSMAATPLGGRVPPPCQKRCGSGPEGNGRRSSMA